MLLPEIDENQADFVLGYAKEGLDKLVRKLDLDEEKENLVADLQPDLIMAFSNKFPEADLKELDNVVTWIILKSATRLGNK